MLKKNVDVAFQLNPIYCLLSPIKLKRMEKRINLWYTLF